MTKFNLPPNLPFTTLESCFSIISMNRSTMLSVCEYNAVIRINFHPFPCSLRFLFAIIYSEGICSPYLVFGQWVLIKQTSLQQQISGCLVGYVG